VEAAQKAGEDVSQMDLDAVALTDAEKAKELKQKNASVGTPYTLYLAGPIACKRLVSTLAPGFNP
jgi:hypothetical protein